MKELLNWKNKLRILEAHMNLSENKAQAEKILAANGVTVEDPNYVALKEKLLQNNNIGYLGPFIRLVYAQGPQQVEVNYEDINAVYDTLQQEKELVKMLPQPLLNYPNLDQLLDDLDSAKHMRTIKRFVDKYIYNKSLRVNLLQYLQKSNVQIKQNFAEVIKGFMTLSESHRTEFTKKSDRYQDFNSYIHGMEQFTKNIQRGFGYSFTIQKLNGFGDDIDVVYTDEEKEFILARIHTYEAAQKVGTTAWCIVGERYRWNEYVKPGYNQYFFFNFTAKNDNEVMIAFTMDQKNEITACHDRYDDAFRGVKKYLSGLGILPKVYELNQRESMKAKYGKKGKNYGEAYGSLITKKDGTQVVEPDKSIEKEVLGKAMADLMSEIISANYSEHLDLILTAFERVEITHWAYTDDAHRYNRYDDRDESNKVKTNKSYNLTEILIDSTQQAMVLIRAYAGRMYDDEGVNLENIVKKFDEKKWVEALRKIYERDVNLEQGTKHSLLLRLKKAGLDPLTLSKNKKAKYGQSLGASEFGMSAHRGDNMRPYIQNKMSAWRKGEDVEWNGNEIIYAIDNGYGDFFKEYYTKELNDDPHMTIDYETMRIMQKLGLMDKVAELVVRKADVEGYGAEGLNSIEHSIYQHAKMKQAS